MKEAGELTFSQSATHPYQIEISHELEDSAWDAFLAQMPDGHHVQSSLWSQLKATMNWRVVRIVVRQASAIVGGMQILFRPLPLGQCVGYVPRGPLLLRPDDQLAERLVTTIRQVMKAERMVALLLQPPDDDVYFTQHLPTLGFGPCPVVIGVDATVKIDLTPSLDDILAQMKSKTRYNIRLGLRKGITIRKGTRADLPHFYELLLATSERQGFTAYPLDYFEAMWSLFEPHGYIHLFFACCGQERVSTNLAVGFGETLVYKKGAWNGRHGNLRPNEVMHWGIMQWAKEQGYRFYDLEGIEVEAAQSALNGQALPGEMLDSTSRFKLGFGGQVLLLPPPLAYVRNPALRWGYNKMVPKLQTRSSLNALLRRMQASS